MFYKLISKLPFSPSLTDELTACRRAVAHEVYLRKLGLFLLIPFICTQLMALGIQTQLQPSEPIAPAVQSIRGKDNLGVHQSHSVANLSEPKNTGGTFRKGDMLQYRLSAKNTANRATSNYEAAFDVSSLLANGNLVDASGGRLAVISGMTYLIWPPAQLVRDGTHDVSILIQASDTHQPLETIYGNEVTLTADSNTAQALASYITQPSVPIIWQIVLLVCIVLTTFYLYVRSRLIMEELAIIHSLELEPTPNRSLNTRDEKHAFATIMSQVRSQLNAHESFFSKITHLRYIDKISTIFSRVLWRPYATLGALTLASCVLFSLLVIRSFTIIKLSGMETVYSLAVGAIIGLLIEVVKTKGSSKA